MDTDALPPEIQQALRRKSSRDPNSRFAKKLHILLSYSTEHPELENQIGVAWISDTEFKMNKKILGSIMGIKVNTLNVNLRDLHFIQQQHDRDGWTRWKKDNFTRSMYSSGEPSDVNKALKHPQQNSMFLQMPITSQISPPEHMFPNFIISQTFYQLGNCSKEEIAQFNQECLHIWKEEMGFDFKPIQANFVIEKCASFFKRQEQPYDNAKQVIKAIIAPSEPNELSYRDLCKLLAMFGPADTIMLKILSLLQVSNETGQWLDFNSNSQTGIQYNNQQPLVSGYFDYNQPNCLVINKTFSTDYTQTERVWNNPVKPHSDNIKYISDQSNNLYSSWNEYFQSHPIPTAPLPWSI